MIRAFALSVVAIFSLTVAALATPPRLTTLEDRLEGVSETHFYVTREFADNRGSHWVESRDVYLVEIDRETGAPSNWWLLRRIIVEQAGFGSDKPKWREEPLDAINPIDVLRDNRAEPVWAVEHENDPPKYALTSAGLTMQLDDGGTTQLMSMAQLLARVSAQVTSMSVLYPEMSEENWRSEGILAGPFTIGEDVECKLTGRMHSHIFRDVSWTGLAIDCDFWEADITRVQIIISLP
jgi:hypothetical protein